MKKIIIISLFLISIIFASLENLKKEMSDYTIKEYIDNDTTYFIQIQKLNGNSKGYGMPLSWKQKPVKEIADSLIKWYNKD